MKKIKYKIDDDGAEVCTIDHLLSYIDLMLSICEKCDNKFSTYYQLMETKKLLSGDLSKGNPQTIILRCVDMANRCYSWMKDDDGIQNIPEFEKYLLHLIRKEKIELID